MATAPSLSPGILLHDLAHELRQPLGAIESIAYYLSLVLPREDAKIQEQLTRLQQLVEQSDWILTNGLHLAEPLLEPAEVAGTEPAGFNELVAEVVSSKVYNPPPRLELAGNLPQVRIDPASFRSLILNLLTLVRQLAAAGHPSIVRTAARDSGIALEFETTAPGYRSENALGPGANLSLACARKIAEAQGGSVECAVDPALGIRLRVTLLA